MQSDLDIAQPPQLTSVVENQLLCVKAISCTSVNRNGGKKTIRREHVFDVRADIAGLSV